MGKKYMVACIFGAHFPNSVLSSAVTPLPVVDSLITLVNLLSMSFESSTGLPPTTDHQKYWGKPGHLLVTVKTAQANTTWEREAYRSL